MNDEFAWWFLVVGIAIGATIVWLLRGSIAREDADLDARERVAEAAWISRTIESSGGIAPADLVEQVLELHRAYLERATAEAIDAARAEDPAETAEVEAADTSP